MERPLDRQPELASCFWCGAMHPADHSLAVCATCAARFTTMRSLAMHGSHSIDAGSIDAVLSRTSVRSSAQRLAH